MYAGNGNPTRRPTRGLTVARLSRIALGIAQRVASKARQWIGTAEASAYCGTCVSLRPVDSNAGSSADHAEPDPDGGRLSALFQTALIWIWVAFLLLVVGYAMFEGERVLAKLDSLRVLAAYSTGVRRMVRPDRGVTEANAQPPQSPSATRVP